MNPLKRILLLLSRFFFLYSFKALASDHRKKLIKKYKGIKYFASTTDVWTRSNRSFIAVSLHYFVDSAEPELKSDFIACEHFTGRHTHDKVAEKLYAIFERFEIRDKVKFVTTDGAGEYTAAFKVFADNYESIYLHDDDDDDENGIHLNGDDGNVLLKSTTVSGTGDSMAIMAPQPGPSNASLSSTSAAPVTTPVTQSDLSSACQNRNYQSAEEQEEEMNSDVDVISPMNVVYAGGRDHNKNDKDSFVLHDLDEILRASHNPRILGKMNRIDCSAHKADKLASIDAATALNDDPDYAAVHKSVFDKVHKIWSIKESRINAEHFKKITGKNIFGPHRIRWLKMHEAVSSN